MSGDVEPAGAPETHRPLYSEPRLAEALAVEGLEQEIALLRVRLDELLAEKPIDYPLVTQLAGTLVRAVATQHRISPRARKDLANNITALLNSLGDQLLPADR